MSAPGRILAIDPGTVRVGVAISDPEQRLAVPLTTLDASPGLPEEVAALAASEGVAQIIVGYPKHLSGRAGSKAEDAESLAATLAGHTGLPVVLVDERLSTVEATRRLREAGITGPKAREVIDRTAAAVILEAFLARAGRSGGIVSDD